MKIVRLFPTRALGTLAALRPDGIDSPAMLGGLLSLGAGTLERVGESEAGMNRGGADGIGSYASGGALLHPLLQETTRIILRLRTCVTAGPVPSLSAKRIMRSSTPIKAAAFGIGSNWKPTGSIRTSCDFAFGRAGLPERSQGVLRGHQDAKPHAIIRARRR